MTVTKLFYVIKLQRKFLDQLLKNLTKGYENISKVLSKWLLNGFSIRLFTLSRTLLAYSYRFKQTKNT